MVYLPMETVTLISYLWKVNRRGVLYKHSIALRFPRGDIAAIHPVLALLTHAGNTIFLAAAFIPKFRLGVDFSATTKRRRNALVATDGCFSAYPDYVTQEGFYFV